MDAKVEESASGLELRAYVDILKALGEQARRRGLGLPRGRTSRATSSGGRRIGLYLVGELKATALETAVVARSSRRRRGSPAARRRRARAARQPRGRRGAEDVARAAQDERKIQTALGTLLGLESDVYADVRALLDHPLMSVRTRLSALLVGHAAAYLDAVRADLAASDLSDRARRTCSTCWSVRGPRRTPATCWSCEVLLEHDDWGVRADTVRLLRRWVRDEAADPTCSRRRWRASTALLETETDPYVRFCAREDDGACTRPCCSWADRRGQEPAGGPRSSATGWRGRRCHHFDFGAHLRAVAERPLRPAALDGRRRRRGAGRARDGAPPRRTTSSRSPRPSSGTSWRETGRRGGETSSS